MVGRNPDVGCLTDRVSPGLGGLVVIVPAAALMVGVLLWAGIGVGFGFLSAAFILGWTQFVGL